MRSRKFYHYGLVYMCCRLFCNVISSLMNFYMIYVLRISSTSSSSTDDGSASQTPMEIALIPLLMFLSSVVMSSILDKCYSNLGKRRTFSIGGILMTISCASLSLISPETAYFMYPIAALIGCSQVLLLNTAITLISDVIGL